MCFRSVGCGMANETPSQTQSDTLRTAAAHMMPSFAFAMKLAI
jgi:hypothetical protein